MDLLVFLKQTGQIVVGFIRNGIFKENGSRRNDADDIALNESLCLLRIFKLFADGYFIRCSSVTGVQMCALPIFIID